MTDLNKAKSVMDRLRHISQQRGLPLHLLQVMYYQERLLARLEQSTYWDRFVLKGGLYLYARSDFGRTAASRPTRDIDLLATLLPSGLDRMEDIWREVITLDLGDGVRFDPETLKVTRIKEDQEYEGVRVTFLGFIGRARQSMQVDIGFGDPVTPRTVDFAFPTLLEKMPLALQAYTVETVIAEKFEAMVSLNVVNTRFKDFFDLYQLLSTETLEAASLRRALERTFQHRGTDLNQPGVIFTDEFKTDPLRQQGWTHFLKGLESRAPQKFFEVMDHIQAFLEPVVLRDQQGQWKPRERMWGSL